MFCIFSFHFNIQDIFMLQLNFFIVKFSFFFFQTDCMSTLEKENEYREEHFDFIQKNLRKFCLKCKSNKLVCYGFGFLVRLELTYVQ